MLKKIKVLGLITARGGSKGIPGKNIKKIAGKPLIFYTINEAKKSKLLSRVIISTDSKKIANISIKCGGDVPFIRPSNLASDTSSSVAVAKHAVTWLRENNGERYDYIMILQPTSPLRTAFDIDECIRLAIKKKADSVMSMVEIPDYSPKKIKKIRNGQIYPFFSQIQEGIFSERRQSLTKAYKRNCAVYLTKTNFLMEGDMFGKRSLAYIMPLNRSTDINNHFDFILAEHLISNNKK